MYGLEDIKFFVIAKVRVRVAHVNSVEMTNLVMLVVLVKPEILDLKTVTLANVEDLMRTMERMWK